MHCNAMQCNTIIILWEVFRYFSVKNLDHGVYTHNKLIPYLSTRKDNGNAIELVEKY